MKHVKYFLLFSLILALMCISLTACEVTDMIGGVVDDVLGGVFGDGECTHAFDSWTETTPATCELKGVETRTCSSCGEEEQRATPALGHDEIAHAAQMPTCLENGWDAYVTCTRCTHTTYTEIPALGHDEVAHEAEDPTCVQNGWEAYVTCTRCTHTTYVSVPALGHDEVAHAAQAPTCLENGWKAYVTCTRCAHTTYVSVPALGHDEIAHEAQAPTCTDDGWEAHVTCARCTYSTLVEVPALGHDEIEHEAQEPTCTEAGWAAYKSCNRCDYDSCVEIPALGHDMVTFDAKMPTCTEAGWEAHQGCTRCTYFAYEVIPALGHELVETPAQAPTCTENGWDAYVTCTRCTHSTYAEIFALGHDEIEHEAQAPSCSENGWNAYVTCTRCTHTTYMEISALGHDLVHYEAKEPTATEYGWEAYDACTRCPYSTFVQLLPLDHIYIEHEGKAPTCTEEGWYSYTTCDHCDYTSYEAIPALGHNLVEHEAQAPTCTEIGWEAYNSCNRCDYSTYEEVVALGHDLVERRENAPTCTEFGWSAYDFCRRCSYTTYEEIAALGHAYERGICVRCDHRQQLPQLSDRIELPGMQAETEMLFFFADYQDWLNYCTENNLPADVVADSETFFEENILVILRPIYERENEGTALYYEYSETGYVIKAVSVYATEGEAASAAWHVIPVSLALLEGREEIEVYWNDELLGSFALDRRVTHIFDEGVMVQAPTCSVPGIMRYTCPDCGFKKDALIPTVAHTFGEWNAVEANGCAGSPYSLRVCLLCQYVEYRLNESGVLHPHDFELTYTAPTCEARGTLRLTCRYCGIVGADEILPALGHDLSWTQNTEAHWLTCTRNGCSYTTAREAHVADSNTPCLDGVCVDCGYLMWDGQGHQLSTEWVSDANGHWLTCTRPGCGMTVAHDVHKNAQAICTDTEAQCTVCGTTFAPNGHHRMGEWEQVSAPTCVMQGQWKKSCIYCGASQIRYTPALGHVWSAYTVIVAPTETTNGIERRTCRVCGETQEAVLFATGHHFGAWQILEQPTCTQAGEKRRDCTECDVFQVVSIPALGHTVFHWRTTVAPTCTEEGIESGYCYRCGLYAERTVDALDHEWGAYHYNTTTHWLACTRCDVMTAPVAHRGGTATCTAQANCADCGAPYGKIPGHRFDVAYTVDADTHYFICLNGCGERRDEEAHRFVARVETMQVQDDGAQITYTHRLYETCGICGHDVLVQEVVNSEHYGCEIMPAVAPGCMTDGWTVGWRCAVPDCGEVYQAQERIPALGHEYVDGACIRCGLADHVCTNGTWINTQRKTCTQDGIQELRCHCGNTIRTRVTPATGHLFIQDVCVNCGETRGGVHLCRASDYVFLIEPTCTESGVKEYLCSCGNRLYTQVAPALGHSFRSGRCTRCGTAECDHLHTRTLIGYPATCTTAGLSNGTLCLDCDMWVEVQSTIYPLGHDYSTAWGYNLDSHYHACQRTGCTAKTDVGAHVYDNALDEMCNICRAIRGQAFISLGGTVYESDNDMNWTNNNLLSGVSCVVTVNGNTYTTTTNSSGRFSFAEIPAGNITLTFTKSGYITAVYSAVIADNADLQIVMDVDVSNTLSGRITIADRDMDFTNNSPLANATITIVRITSTNELRFVTTTNSNGYYSFSGLTAGVYTMRVERDGYITIEQTVQVRQDEANIQNVVIEAISDTQINDGYASGYVYDARTGLPVNGLSVIIRAGINNTTGPILMTLRTNTSGQFTTSALAPGNYTAQIVDERALSDEVYRYGTITIALKVMSDTTIYNQNATVSNSVGLSVDGMRIVLTWGSTPRDLDSHLSGTINGSSFHVYYANKYYGSYVDLDVDDITSYGPETITIRNMGDGIYKYYIYNFSGGGDYVLANSGATIKVYMDGSVAPAYTFNVPYSSGRFWHVFTYNSITGEFTIINQISSSAP